MAIPGFSKYKSSRVWCTKDYELIPHRKGERVSDAILFHSRNEAERYIELRALEAEGRVFGLELQPRFAMVVNGVLVTRYVADFKYSEINCCQITIEDVKGFRTDVFTIKEKLFRALFPEWKLRVVKRLKRKVFAHGESKFTEVVKGARRKTRRSRDGRKGES